MRLLRHLGILLRLHSFSTGARILILFLITSVFLQAPVFCGALPPTITGFSPASGAEGVRVTITGTNFTGATAVVFNGATAVFEVASATQIIAVVPKAATSGPIALKAPGGEAKSMADFKVALPPAIRSFSPVSAPVGTKVIVAGSNFTDASAVSFNGVAATFEVVSPSQIATAVPKTASSGPVRVTGPGGSATGGVFTVMLPPTITGFTPASGMPAQTITITGTELSGATAVTFNGVSADFHVVSPTQITATAPPATAAGPISVSTSVGTATSTGKFTYCCLPTVTSITPSTGPAGTQVAIYGTFFHTVTSIRFNDVPCTTFRMENDVLIVATIPPGLTEPGPVTMTNALGSVSSRQLFIPASQ